MQALVTTSQQNANSSSAVGDVGLQGQVVVTNNRPNAASSSAISHVDHQSQFVITANRSLEALWEKAADHFCDEDKQHINILNADKREVLEDIIKVIEDKRKLCTLKQWKTKKTRRVCSTAGPVWQHHQVDQQIQGGWRYIGTV